MCRLGADVRDEHGKFNESWAVVIGCGCGRSGIVQQMPGVLRGEQTDGVYPLATYPGCTTPHHGQYEGQGVFVVARGDAEFERLFRFTKLAEASTYAREINAHIESLPSAGLCNDAVLDLYG